MMKKKIALALSTIMAFSGIAVNAFAADSKHISIEVDGLKQPVNTAIINVDGYNLLGMRTVFEILGAEVDWFSKERRVAATKDDIKVNLYVDNSEAYVNDVKIDMPTDVLIKDGSTYIPIRFVSDCFGYEISWDEKSRTISVDTEPGEYLFLDVEEREKTLAEKNGIVLTFEEALELARSKSSDAKTIEETIEYLDELRDDLGDSLTLLDLQGAQINSNLLDETKTESERLQFQVSMQANIESVITVARGIKNADIQRTLMPYNLEMINDGIEIMLRSYLTSIKSLNYQISLLEASIERGEENLKNLELKHELGYESDYNLQSARTTQKQNLANLESLKLSLENARQELKTFLKLESSANVYVEYEADFSELNDIELESYVSVKCQTDPSIKVLEKQVDYQKYVERTNVGLQSESALSVENSLKSAQRSLSDGQINMEKNIRNAYNNLLQLKEQDKNLKLALEQAKSDYNAAVSSYLAGQSTIYNVNMAKLGILSAEKNIEDNKLTYSSLMFTFEHPYLLGSK